MVVSTYVAQFVYKLAGQPAHASSISSKGLGQEPASQEADLSLDES